MKYQLVISRLEVEIMITNEKLEDYKEIYSMNDSNIIVKSMIEMYKERIKQYNDAITLLKSSNN